jgi:AcrR family transcriptional regulator
MKAVRDGLSAWTVDVRVSSPQAGRARSRVRSVATQRARSDAVDDINERLIDATEACFERYGVMKTTVEDIANSAGVSRATVYRYASGRDDLILAVLMRSADKFFARLGRRLVRPTGSIGDRIVDGILYTLDQVRADENLQLLFASEAAGVTGTIVGASEALFTRSAEYLQPLLAQAQAAGELRADLNADELAEWLIRIILSLLTVQGPKPRTRNEIRTMLEHYLLPALRSSS